MNRKDPAPDSPWLLPGEMPAPLPPIEFPSKHVEITRHWEKRDEGTIDLSTLPELDESDDEDDYDPNVEPVELRVRPLASVCQAHWAQDMVAQYPKKSQKLIAQQNHTSWEQLVYWARSSLDGLPEKVAKKSSRKRVTTPKKGAKPVKAKTVKAKTVKAVSKKRKEA